MHKTGLGKGTEKCRRLHGFITPEWNRDQDEVGSIRYSGLRVGFNAEIDMVI